MYHYYFLFKFYIYFIRTKISKFYFLEKFFMFLNCIFSDFYHLFKNIDFSHSSACYSIAQKICIIIPIRLNSNSKFISTKIWKDWFNNCIFIIWEQISMKYLIKLQISILESRSRLNYCTEKNSWIIWINYLGYIKCSEMNQSWVKFRSVGWSMKVCIKDF